MNKGKNKKACKQTRKKREESKSIQERCSSIEEKKKEVTKISKQENEQRHKVSRNIEK